MKIAIYGAGNYGKYVLEQIRNHECAKVSVAFWIDNFEEEHDVCDLVVYSEKVFFGIQKFNEIDAIVIAIDRAETAKKLACSLLAQGYKQVYLVLPNGFIPRVPILNKEGELGPFIKPYNYYQDIKPILPYLEVMVNKCCNLNCKRCGNFSNLETEKRFLNLDKFEGYLKQLKKKVKDINVFNLMGGEPLLNPQLELYIDMVREYFPKTNIQITTNGLLIPKMSSKLIDTIKQCHTIIYISQYLPTREMLDTIIDFLERNQILYGVTSPRTQFRKIISCKQEDGNKAFARYAETECTCHALIEGKIYVCGFIERVYAMQNYLNIYIEENELINSSVDLMSDEIDGWDIMWYLKQPTPLCRLCASEDEWVPWETGQPRKEDWIID